MASYQLKAEPRDIVGTNEVKKMRREDLVPAVVYGQGKPSINVVLTARDFDRAFESGEPLLDLNIGDDKRVVLIKDIQRNPLRGTVNHVDFYEVSMDRPVDTIVSVVLVGEQDRVQDEGILNLVMRTLNISCLPGDIPENITIDVSEMVMGDTVLVGDLKISDDITLLDDFDEVVVTIATPVEEVVEEEEVEDDEDVELVEGEEVDEDSADESDSEE